LGSEFSELVNLQNETRISKEDFIWKPKFSRKIYLKPKLLRKTKLKPQFLRKILIELTICERTSKITGFLRA